MIPTQEPFLFQDFQRAFKALLAALKAAIRYVLLVGESAAGKSRLLDFTRGRADRCLYRIVYFNHASLNSCGLIRVLARTLRTPIRRSQSETVQAITSILAEESTLTCLWVDEAHLLPDQTFDELRTLVEADLGQAPRLTVALAGLPDLRQRLHAPHLFPFWRRIQCRIELTGLRSDEARPFAAHVLGPKQEARLNDDALTFLFEHSRGLPGLLGPYLDLVVDRLPKGPITTEAIQPIVQDWDLA
jgi:type II secretory pathway predicted ATPase ExeA